MNFFDATDSEKIRSFKGKSGLYVIREKGLLGTVLYVGESHTDRLYSTLLRHFQRWKGKTAGPTYDKKNCVIAVKITSAETAIEQQNDAIGFFWPRDNVKENPAEMEQGGEGDSPVDP